MWKMIFGQQELINQTINYSLDGHFNLFQYRSDKSQIIFCWSDYILKLQYFNSGICYKNLKKKQEIQLSYFIASL